MKTSPRLCCTVIDIGVSFYFLRIPEFAQEQPSAPAFAKLDSSVMQLMRIAKVPGLSLVLLRDAKPDYSQSYGLTQADSIQKVDANTVFEAASLTKPTFAYAVLQLVEEGKLDLDKPLYDYLPYPGVASDKRHKKSNDSTGSKPPCRISVLAQKPTTRRTFHAICSK